MTEIDFLVRKCFEMTERGETDRAEHAERAALLLERVGFSRSQAGLVFLHMAHPLAIVPMPAADQHQGEMRGSLCFGLSIPWRKAGEWIKSNYRPAAEDKMNHGNLSRVFRADLMGRHKAAAIFKRWVKVRWIAGAALVAIGEQRADAINGAALRWAEAIGQPELAGGKPIPLDGAPSCAPVRPDQKEGIKDPSVEETHGAPNHARPPILGLPKQLWNPGTTLDQVHHLALQYWRRFMVTEDKQPKTDITPAEFVGAIIAARERAKGSPERYMNAVLVNVRPDYLRRAGELIEKHERIRKENAKMAKYV